METSPLAILNPRVWPSLVRGVLTSLRDAIRARAPFAPLVPAGGALGLPDLLVAPDGLIVAAKYGRHAGDQWTVDEVLELAASSPARASAATR